jgi:hypothetical protein
MKSDFEKMTQAELRAYVIANPKDDEAFHLWADHATANAPKTIYPPVSLEEAERIIRSKIEEKIRDFLPIGKPIVSHVAVPSLKP